MILTREILYGKSCEMLQKSMVIYKIQRLSDGKIYIGKTTRTLAERMKEHLRNIRPCYIDRAIHRYGIEAFDISIVEECTNQDELNKREIYWIAHLDCKYPNGFNLTNGSKGIPGYKAPPELRKRLSEMRKGRPNTPEQRRQISESLKGREFSDEHKANISAAKLGHSVSDETKAILSAKNTGKKDSLETRQKKSAANKNKRAVRCVEENKVFESIRAAAKWIGKSGGTVMAACKNPNYTAGGYHWEYVDTEK